METTKLDLHEAYKAMREMLYALAKEYVDGGLQIVCVHSALCSNGIKSGKSPTHLGWQKQPLTWEELKREMDRTFFREGGCNIGIKTGKLSGIICVDIDQKSGGMGWYMEHEMHLGNPIVEMTPTGGLHLYYRYPSALLDGDQQLLTRSSKGQVFKGVDILADGAGQAVTYPSFHSSGIGQYQFKNAMNLLDVRYEADELPQWIVDQMLATQKVRLEVIEGSGAGGSGDRQADAVDVEQAIRAIGNFPPANQGDGGDFRTLQAAMLCKDFGLSVSQVFEVLKNHYNQKCSPPWSTSELHQKVQNAFKYGKLKVGSRSMEMVFPGSADDLKAKTALAVDASNAASPSGQPGDTNPTTVYSKRNTVFSAKVFINRNISQVRCFNNQFYMYEVERKCWRLAGDNDIEQMLMFDFDRSTNGGRQFLTARASFFPEVRRVIKSMLNMNVEVLPENQWFSGKHQGSGYVAFSNGILNLSTGEILGHSADFFTLQCLPFDYDATATCPKFLEFLTDIWDNDEELIESLRMWIGYLLVPQCNLQRMAIFRGASRSGKSTIAGVIEALVGRANCASPTLGGMAGEFGLANLVGKRVLVIQEADRISGDKAAVATERLKCIASNDAVEINRKGRDFLYQQLNAKLILICNRTPGFLNEQGSLTNRMLVFPFWNTYQDREDFFLLDKLKVEVAGVFNWALESAKRILDGETRLPQAMRGIVALQEIAEQLDTVEAFVAECVVITGDSEDFVKSIDVWTAYKRFCRDSGRHAKSRQVFSKEFNSRKNILNLKVQRREGFQSLRGFERLKLVEESSEGLF